MAFVPITPPNLKLGIGINIGATNSLGPFNSEWTTTVGAFTGAGPPFLFIAHATLNYRSLFNDFEGYFGNDYVGGSGLFAYGADGSEAVGLSLTLLQNGVQVGPSETFHGYTWNPVLNIAGWIAARAQGGGGLTPDQANQLSFIYNAVQRPAANQP